MTLAYYAWAAWVLGFGWNRLLAGGSVQRLYRAWTGELPGTAVRPVQLVVEVVVAALLVAVLPGHGRTRA
jgi:hypothetical protein